MKAARSRGRKKPAWQSEIALERIGILFRLAAEEFGTHPGRSHRYVQLARRIAMRHNVKIPKELKGSFCNKCNRYLSPGSNCVVRSSSRTKAMETRCLGCGHVSRHPYAREKKAW